MRGETGFGAVGDAAIERLVVAPYQIYAPRASGFRGGQGESGKLFCGKHKGFRRPKTSAKTPSAARFRVVRLHTYSGEYACTQYAAAPRTASNQGAKVSAFGGGKENGYCTAMRRHKCLLISLRLIMNYFNMRGSTNLYRAV